MTWYWWFPPEDFEAYQTIPGAPRHTSYENYREVTVRKALQNALQGTHAMFLCCRVTDIIEAIEKAEIPRNYDSAYDLLQVLLAGGTLPTEKCFYLELG